MRTHVSPADTSPGPEPEPEPGPSVHVDIGKQQQSVPRGADVTLTCQISTPGVRVVDIRWSRQGAPLPSGQCVCVCVCVRALDCGVCQAVSGDACG